jgi:hypothetical protein
MNNNPKESKAEVQAMEAILALDKFRDEANHLLSTFENGLLDRVVAVATEVIRIERGEI